MILKHWLDFEKSVEEDEKRLEELKDYAPEEGAAPDGEAAKLEKNVQERLKDIYSKLTPWQITQVARHPGRPYTLDYIQNIFEDFIELHGDRRFKDDLAVVGGVAKFDGEPCVVVGHQKGRNTKEQVLRNFGMPHPEGFRKALRLMELAERFGKPLFTFIDTTGAYPGIGAEERGQSEAIAGNLMRMSTLRVPIISTVIGEGGSGGALAIGVADRVLMLEYSTYSVISPEGCAAILWKSAEKASEAADVMGITSGRLSELDLIDQIIKEPLGGAHRDMDGMAQRVKETLKETLSHLDGIPIDKLINMRFDHLMKYGHYKSK